MNKWIQSVGVPPDEMKEWWLIHLLALWIMLQWTSVQFSSVTQSCPTLCDPMDCSTPGLPVHLKLMSIKSVMSSNHLILCHPFLCPPSIFPSIQVFSNESALGIRWQMYWSFSFNISPSSEYPSPLGWTGWISSQFKRLSRVFFNTTVRKHQFFGTQPSLWFNSYIHTWVPEKP